MKYKDLYGNIVANKATFTCTSVHLPPPFFEIRPGTKIVAPGTSSHQSLETLSEQAERSGVPTTRSIREPGRGVVRLRRAGEREREAQRTSQKRDCHVAILCSSQRLGFSQ